MRRGGLLVGFVLLSLPGAALAQMGIESVVPAAGEAGTQVTVTITGGPDCVFGYTSEVAFFPASTITHGEITPIEYNVIETQLTIPADASPGLQRVTVSNTSGVTACVGEDMFEVTCTGCGASLLSITPGSGAAGADLTVEVLGEGTHFAAGSVLAFSGSGVQVTGSQALSETRLQADLHIDAGAAEGPRDATVTTGAEVARGQALFRVEAVALGVSPDTAAQGELVAEIVLSDGGLDMTQVTAVSLGPDVVVGGFQAESATSLSLTAVSVSPDAVVGLVDIVLGLGAGARTFQDAFGITQGPATALVSATPARADRGHPGIAVGFVGEHTHWDGGEVAAGLSGLGDRVDALVAADATHLGGTLVLGDAAEEGLRSWTVAVNTGRCVWQAPPAVPCESVTLADAFTVSAPGTIQSVTPSLVEAGAEIDIAITAVDAAFAAGATELLVEPPDGIEVLSVSVASADQLTASLRISADAPGSVRSLRTVSGPDVAVGAALLDVNHPEVSRLVPRAIAQGTVGLPVRVECVDVSLSAAAQVSVSGTGVTLGAVTFDPARPDQIMVVVDVAADAPLGPRDVSVTAGGLTAAGPGAMSIVSPTTGDDGGCASAGGSPTLPGIGLLLAALIARRQRARRPASRR